MGGLLNVILNRGSWEQIVACLISATVVVFLTMPIHEFAHGFAATKLGDPTPRWQGRMSLNPLHHLDYFGALMIYLVGFGFAKPVQVDSRYFDNPKRDMAIVAFAGPLSNLIVAVISSFLSNLVVFLFYTLQITSNAVATVLIILVNIFSYIAIINVSLAMFNLVPIPPLDGSKILGAFLPNRIYYQLMQYERYFMIFIMFLIFASSGFSNGLSKIVYMVYNGIDSITSLPFNLLLN